MKNPMEIHKFREKARELLRLDPDEGSIRLVIGYFVLLAQSFSDEEKVEATIAKECFEDIEAFLKNELKVLDEYESYFKEQKKIFDDTLDVILNPENYDTRFVNAMSLSERQLKIILSTLDKEFIPLAKMPR